MCFKGDVPVLTPGPHIWLHLHTNSEQTATVQETQGKACLCMTYLYVALFHCLSVSLSVRTFISPWLCLYVAQSHCQCYSTTLCIASTQQCHHLLSNALSSSTLSTINTQQAPDLPSAALNSSTARLLPLAICSVPSAWCRQQGH